MLGSFSCAHLTVAFDVGVGIGHHQWSPLGFRTCCRFFVFPGGVGVHIGQLGRSAGQIEGALLATNCRSSGRNLLAERHIADPFFVFGGRGSRISSGEMVIVGSTGIGTSPASLSYRGRMPGVCLAITWKAVGARAPECRARPGMRRR